MNTAPQRPASQFVTCVCGQVLAERWGDCYAIKLRGRRIIARELVVVQCESCGATWKPEG